MKHLKLILTVLAILIFTVSFSNIVYSPKKKEPIPTNPTEQKVYDHFWKSEYWTSAKIKALKGETLWKELEKLGIKRSDKSNFMIAYKFLKLKIYPAKHTKETNEIVKKHLQNN